jgi:hypothetical protein
MYSAFDIETLSAQGIANLAHVGFREGPPRPQGSSSHFRNPTRSRSAKLVNIQATLRPLTMQRSEPETTIHLSVSISLWHS